MKKFHNAKRHILTNFKNDTEIELSAGSNEILNIVGNVSVNGDNLVGSNYAFLYGPHSEVPTVIADTVTFVPLVMSSYVAGLHIDKFDLDLVNGSVTYTGVITKIFNICCVFSAIALFKDKITARIAINGLTIVETNISMFSNNPSPTQIPSSMSCQGVIQLSTGDTVKMYLLNETSVSDIYVEHWNMRISSA